MPVTVQKVLTDHNGCVDNLYMTCTHITGPCVDGTQAGKRCSAIAIFGDRCLRHCAQCGGKGWYTLRYNIGDEQFAERVACPCLKVAYSA
jgi:hypothetical protein